MNISKYISKYKSDDSTVDTKTTNLIIKMNSPYILKEFTKFVKHLKIS